MDRPVRALLVDAGGSLLLPAEPVAATYARIGAPHGVRRTEAGIRGAFARAFRSAGETGDGRRYVGDGRPFWRRVVAEATGVDDPALFEALYGWYARPEAWTVAPGAESCCRAARAAGIRVVLASNWDTRLRPLVGALGVDRWLDDMAISCELGVEKPAPELFLAACELAGAPPSRAVHVGDDPVADGAGARGAGMRCWLLGRDVRDWAEVRARLEGGT